MQHTFIYEILLCCIVDFVIVAFCVCRNWHHHHYYVVLNWHRESFNSTFNVSSLEISDLIWLKLISTHCSTLQSCGSTWVILDAKTTCNYPVIGFKTTPILSSILLHTHWYDLFDDGVSNFLGFFLICFHISITDRKMSVLITNWLYH